MKLLVAGGASYIGSWLVPQLLAEGHDIVIYDRLLFGSGFLPKDNDCLKVIKADMRDLASWRAACMRKDAVIYLASISREAMCQQNPELAQKINVECFAPCVQAAKEEGVNRFIYASSVAVYGSSTTPLDEDSALAPTTLYGQGKMLCEQALWAEASPEFTVTATRSASVCGYAPRMRLDLTINRMIHDAMRKGIITVEGGNQVRTHIHIQEVSDFYKLLLTIPAEQIAGKAFNLVEVSEPVIHSALRVAGATGTKIKRVPRADDRSYAVSGARAATLGYAPKKTINDAIAEVILKFRSGYWTDSETNPRYQNMAHVS